MFLLTTATGLSQTTSLACLVVAGLGYQWVGRGRAWAGAFLVGSALGFGLTVRPQVMAPAGLVIGGATLLRLLRERRFDCLASLFVSSGVWLLLIGLYNRALTGSPFVLPWSLFFPAERWGFVQPLEGNPFVHTPWTALENLVVTAIRFNGWWLGWPLSLGLLGVWWWVGRPRQGTGLWLAMGLALILFHIPYYSSGVSETGPVYYYELLLPASLLGAHALVASFRRWPEATAALLAVHLALGTTTFLVVKTARLGRMMQFVHGPVETVMAAVEPPAVLIYEIALQESLRLGWLNSGFPLRFRSERYPVVTYPRSYPRAVAALRRRYAHRRCWYYRVNPESIQPELLRCEDAEEFLNRPLRLEGPALAIPSTAMKMGLLDPFVGKGSEAVRQ